MIESEEFNLLEIDYGHFDTWLDFSVYLLYVLYLYGGLGSQRLLVSGLALALKYAMKY